MTAPSILYFHRGATRIELRRAVGGTYLLKVNGGETTPIHERELADLVFAWSQDLKSKGVAIAPWRD